MHVTELAPRREVRRVVFASALLLTFIRFCWDNIFALRVPHITCKDLTVYCIPAYGLRFEAKCWAVAESQP